MSRMTFGVIRRDQSENRISAKCALEFKCITNRAELCFFLYFTIKYCVVICRGSICLCLRSLCLMVMLSEFRHNGSTFRVNMYKRIGSDLSRLFVDTAPFNFNFISYKFLGVFLGFASRKHHILDYQHDGDDGATDLVHHFSTLHAIRTD